eukprot:COSAG02_NODE_124_length_35047_cov_31.554179_3_plen_244_part_00
MVPQLQEAGPLPRPPARPLRRRRGPSPRVVTAIAYPSFAVAHPPQLFGCGPSHLGLSQAHHETGPYIHSIGPLRSMPGSRIIQDIQSNISIVCLHLCPVSGRRLPTSSAVLDPAHLAGYPRRGHRTLDNTEGGRGNNPTLCGETAKLPAIQILTNTSIPTVRRRDVRRDPRASTTARARDVDGPARPRNMWVKCDARSARTTAHRQHARGPPTRRPHTMVRSELPFLTAPSCAASATPPLGRS